VNFQPVGLIKLTKKESILGAFNAEGRGDWRLTIDFGNCTEL
jgi:hypothetical protein